MGDYSIWKSYQSWFRCPCLTTNLCLVRFIYRTCLSSVVIDHIILIQCYAIEPSNNEVLTIVQNNFTIHTHVHTQKNKTVKVKEKVHQSEWRIVEFTKYVCENSLLCHAGVIFHCFAPSYNSLVTKLISFFFFLDLRNIQLIYSLSVHGLIMFNITFSAICFKVDFL